MRTTRVAFLLSLLASGSVLFGQGRPTVVDRGPAPIFTSGVDMVTINVSVRDGRGRVVRGLEASDFRLVDSGFGRPIDSVFPSEAALRIAVLVDVSGSMAIDHNIDRAWRAVDTVVDILDAGRDEAALFTFDTVLREVVTFTSELDRFADATEAGTEEPYGKTSLYDAVADTATLVGQFGSSHHALLVVTDGVDTGSRRTAEEVSRVASEVSVPVHLVTVGGPARPPRGRGRRGRRPERGGDRHPGRSRTLDRRYRAGDEHERGVAGGACARARRLALPVRRDVQAGFPARLAPDPDSNVG